MKTNYSAALTTAFGLVAFSALATAQDTASPPMLPPSDAKITMTMSPPPSYLRSPQIAQLATNPSPESVQWSDIKDCTYDMGIRFFAGFKRLEARVDDQIAELTAKRATMNSSTNTKDWDFAMKEMVDSRSYLKSMGEELAKATSETWNQQKDKVGLAWVRTQDAYGKVKSSTTM